MQKAVWNVRKPLMAAISFGLLLSGCQNISLGIISPATSSSEATPVTKVPEKQTSGPADQRTENIQDAQAQPETSTSPARERLTKPMVRADNQMVVAANPHAVTAGLDILRAGGSAVDAAIATQLVLNVVEPQSSGIGGGAFLMHFAAASGAIDAYDGRETAPTGATPDMFLKSDGSRMKFHEAVPGGLSVGVPGVLRMLEMAHQTHGKLPWENLFQPAIQIAEEGFKISPRLHRLADGDRHLRKFTTSAGYFLTEEGRARAVGFNLRNLALADTLRRIAAEGADAFDFMIKIFAVADLVFIGDGGRQECSCRAGLHAFTAGHTTAFTHGVCHIKGWIGIMTPARHADNVIDLNLAASAHAEAALNTGIEIDGHGDMAVIQ